MFYEHIKYLVCPFCFEKLEYFNILKKKDIVHTGQLVCKKCGKEYKIKDGVPRFVEEENYAENFGFEWSVHNQTQYDRYSGIEESKERFEKETKWRKNLEGEIIIEAGCGSGRFTEHAVKTQAMVISFDLCKAVESNYKHNGHNRNLLIVQANIFKMPFKDRMADKIFCFGVLQHTPNPEKAFYELTKKLKKGGKIAADIYPFLKTTWFNTKYYVRPFTKRLNHRLLYWLCKKYISIMWPIAKLNRKIFSPKVANRLNWRLLIPDYTDMNLSEDKLKEWALLDLFDMLSPKYDNPVKLETFRSWFEKYGYKDIDVHMGYNGCEGRGTKI